VPQKGQEKYGVERCDASMLSKGPVYDQAYIQGFFLLHPDLLYYRPNAAWMYVKMKGCPPGQVGGEGGCVVEA
jgi:hypothetical protein